MKTKLILTTVAALVLAGCSDEKPAAKVPPPALELIGAAERAFDEWDSARMSADLAGISTDLHNLSGNTSQQVKARMDETSKHNEVHAAYQAYLKAERAVRNARGSSYESAQVAAFNARRKCREELSQIKRQLAEAMEADDTSTTIQLESKRQACETKLEKLNGEWIKVWYSAEWKLHVP